MIVPCVAVNTVPYKFVAFTLLLAFTFKKEPLALELTLPITSNDSAGVSVPTPRLVKKEPDANPNILPELEPEIAPLADTLFRAMELSPAIISPSPENIIALVALEPTLIVRLPNSCVILPNSVPSSLNMISPPSPSSIRSPAVSIPSAPTITLSKCPTEDVKSPSISK